jgi:hypothetical protein
MKHFYLVMATVLTLGATARAETAAPPAPPPAPVPAPESVAATAVKPGLDNAISVFGVFGYFYAATGVGVSGRYQKTIVPQGLLHLANLHEDLGIEGGVDYYHYGFTGYSLDEFAALVGVVWNFWFDGGRLALYPKLESGFGFGSVSGVSGAGALGYGGFHMLAEAGIAYKVSALTLRGEIGSGAMRVGAGFVF